jgi:hypothetical protein
MIRDVHTDGDELEALRKSLNQPLAASDLDSEGKPPPRNETLRALVAPPREDEPKTFVELLREHREKSKAK